MIDTVQPSRSVPAVTLRPLLADDAGRIRRWLRDMDLLQFTVQVPGPDYEEVRPYEPHEADRYLHDLRCGAGRFSFAIELEGLHVGNIGLKNTDLQAGRAECFIEIGEAAVRGRGVGRRAMELLLDFAFDELLLERIWLGVFDFNHAARRLYLGLGFVLGPRYGDHYVAGVTYAVLGMYLTRKVFLDRLGRGGELVGPG